MNTLGKLASESNFFRGSYQLIKKRFKKFRKNIFKKIDTFWKYIDTGIALIYNFFKFRKLPLDPQKIIMITSRGTYNCHPKAIANEILKRNLPYTIVWVVRKENIIQNDFYPPNIKIVRRGSYEFYEEAATAKIWIDNSFNFAYLWAFKKKNQILIETWHGTFGLKRFDASVNKDKRWIRKAYIQGAKTDYCLANCKFEEELLKNTFWGNAEILPYGHPRNDILFHTTDDSALSLVTSIREKYHLKESDHILLYAPTYREVKNPTLFDIDYNNLLNSLKHRFGGDWYIMIRYHFLDRKLDTIPKKNPYIINVTAYPDIQDLMLLADIGITDYSSWIYDYFFTKKPCFLYVPDLDEYQEKDREFLFPLETTPFPIAKTNTQLCANIESFDWKNYQNDYRTFCEKMMCYEDGHATDRITSKLIEIMDHSI